jgi:hypothetical protein
MDASVLVPALKTLGVSNIHGVIWHTLSCRAKYSIKTEYLTVGARSIIQGLPDEGDTRLTWR